MSSLSLSLQSLEQYNPQWISFDWIHELSSVILVGILSFDGGGGGGDEIPIRNAWARVMSYVPPGPLHRQLDTAVLWTGQHCQAWQRAVCGRFWTLKTLFSAHKPGFFLRRCRTHGYLLSEQFNINHPTTKTIVCDRHSPVFKWTVLSNPHTTGQLIQLLEHLFCS